MRCERRCSSGWHRLTAMLCGGGGCRLTRLSTRKGHTRQSSFSKLGVSSTKSMRNSGV